MGMQLIKRKCNQYQHNAINSQNNAKQLPRNATKCQKMPRNTKKCQDMQRNANNFVGLLCRDDQQSGASNCRVPAIVNVRIICARTFDLFLLDVLAAGETYQGK